MTLFRSSRFIRLFATGGALPHRLTASLGIDNVGDYRYHVFHPIEERTFFTELTWSL